MSSERDPADAYGQSLVVNVRDRAISAAQLRLEPHAVGPTAEHWRRIINNNPDTRETIRALIPEIVDETIFQMMNAIDNMELPVCVPDEGLGELAGRYVGSGMWRSYSAYPVFDPFRDLQ